MVVIPFPFSDLTTAKRRLALVLAKLRGDDLILCQITSQHVRDQYAAELADSDFERGGLKQISSIRPNRLFTADSRIILYCAGHVRVVKLEQVIDKVVGILRDGPTT